MSTGAVITINHRKESVVGGKNGANKYTPTCVGDSGRWHWLEESQPTTPQGLNPAYCLLINKVLWEHSPAHCSPNISGCFSPKEFNIMPAKP